MKATGFKQLESRNCVYSLLYPQYLAQKKYYKYLLKGIMLRKKGE
jgi:hypothetical protein